MGEMVKKGEVIAEVGMTGIAETPYLHFEIRRSGKARNPLPFLK
jgi:murein DD-endopeptidase MepM/ murein hydrolase activator NlpD